MDFIFIVLAPFSIVTIQDGLIFSGRYIDYTQFVLEKQDIPILRVH